MEKTNIQLVGIPLEGMRRNWDYEVISKCIFDNEGNEFMTEKHIPNGSDLDKFEISEDDIPSEVKIAYRYETNDIDNIHLLNAKRCGFGVLRLMRGEMQDKHYMFPIYNYNHAMQIFAYGVITHNNIDSRMSKLILKDQDKRDLLMLCVGQQIYDLIIQKITKQI
jgi:hypothetical protein